MRGFFFSRKNRGTAIMKKLYVGNLPPDASEASVRDLFAAFGTVRSIDLATDIFTGACKGFGFIEMEGHEARAAQAALDSAIAGMDRSRLDAERMRRIREQDPGAISQRRLESAEASYAQAKGRVEASRANLQAAIGLLQLDHIDAFNEGARRNAAILTEMLHGVPGI